MAGSVNKVILIGNLGADPDVRTMQSGDKVVNLSIATSESWKDKTSGERREKTERRNVVDRRLGLDRRRGPGRRRSDDRKSAEDGNMSDEQFEFLMAIDDYKRLNDRPFPTWTEVLEVVKAIGYKKTSEVSCLDPKAHANEKVAEHI